VAAYPDIAYGVVLLLALSESLSLLGAVVPGTAIIVGLAALVPSGALKLYPLLGSAFPMDQLFLRLQRNLSALRASCQYRH